YSQVTPREVNWSGQIVIRRNFADKWYCSIAQVHTRPRYMNPAVRSLCDDLAARSHFVLPSTWPRSAVRARLYHSRVGLIALCINRLTACLTGRGAELASEALCES